MDFRELGFSDEINDYNSEFSDWYFNNFESFITKEKEHEIEFDLSNYFLTDRQSLKNIMLKRNPELAFTFKEFNGSDSKINSPGQSRLSPEWSLFKDFEKRKFDNDREVNKIVFGTPLSIDPNFIGRESQFEVTPSTQYKQWIDDNDDLFPNIVTKDNSNDNYLDSPSKPMEPENELYEYIDYLKRRLRFDFFSVEFLLKDIKKQKERIYDILNKISSYGSQRDMRRIPISLFILTINSLIETSISICNDVIFRIQKNQDKFINFKYIEFVVKPIYLDSVMDYFSKMTKIVIFESNNLVSIKKMIEKSKKLIIDGTGSITELDNQLENLKSVFDTASLAAPAAGTGAGVLLANATIAYEKGKNQIENIRFGLIRDLILSATDEMLNYGGLTGTILSMPKVPEIKD